METRSDRKLVRGLKDISPFFLPSASMSAQEAIAKDRDAFASPKPDRHLRPNGREGGIPSVFCFSVLPPPTHTSLFSNRVFLNELMTIFSEICFLSVSANRMLDSTIQDSLRQLVLPAFQLNDILHPDPHRSGEQTLAHDPEKKVCFFVDPKSLLERNSDLSQILDRVILSVSAESSDSMLAAYQMLGACLQHNPALRFSLLIEGHVTDEMCEMIYERFAKITSQFLGSEIDFLGWANDEQALLNEDLLLEEGGIGRLVREPMKLKLIQLFSGELLLEST